MVFGSVRSELWKLTSASSELRSLKIASFKPLVLLGTDIGDRDRISKDFHNAGRKVAHAHIRAMLASSVLGDVSVVSKNEPNKWGAYLKIEIQNAYHI